MIRRVAAIALFLSCVGTPAWAGALPVTLAWDRNPETTVLGYRVYVGTAPGTYSTVINVGNVTQYTVGGGTVGVRYYFAVTAYVSGSVEGPKSAEVSTVIQSDTTTTTPPPPPPPPPPDGDGGETPPPPPPDGDGGETPPPPPPDPVGLVLQPAAVSGSAVTLSWKPNTGVKVIEYLLEAGSGPGMSDVFNGTVGTVTRITGTVGAGTFYVRVRGRTSDTSSVTSNEVSFSVDEGGNARCTVPPPTPARPSGEIRSGLASVSWKAVTGATSYVVQAGSQPGLSNVFNSNVGPYTAVSTAVPDGFIAYVRVIAVNACGRSAASPEITIR